MYLKHKTQRIFYNENRQDGWIENNIHHVELALEKKIFCLNFG